MPKATTNQKFECLFQWLVHKGKGKITPRGYEPIKTTKDKVLEEIKLEL